MDRFAPPDAPVAQTSFREGMRLEYRLTYGDLVLFAMVHQFCSPVLQFMYLALVALIFSTSAEATVLTAAGWYAGLWLAQAALIGIALVSRSNRTQLTTHAIEVSDRSFYAETAYGQCRYFWPGVVKVVSRPGFVALYVAQHSAQLIPDRAFASPEQRCEFLALVREKIAAR